MTNAIFGVEVSAKGEAVTLLGSAARTAGANGTAVAVGRFSRLMVLLNITASATDAGDTLDVYVDASPDSGTTWINAIHFTQQAGNGSAGKYWAVLDPTSPGTAPVAVTSDAGSGAVRPTVFGGHLRVRWAIADSGNGDSSHTFSVVGYGQ